MNRWWMMGKIWNQLAETQIWLVSSWRWTEIQWVPQFHHRSLIYINHSLIMSDISKIKTASFHQPNSIQIDPTWSNLIQQSIPRSASSLHFQLVFLLAIWAPALGGHWPEPSMPGPPGRSHWPGPGCDSKNGASLSISLVTRFLEEYSLQTLHPEMARQRTLMRNCGH